MKRKNILVPIDFSDLSMKGMASAVNIANTIDGKIHLLHILDQPIRTDLPEDGDIVGKSKRQKEHEAFMRELIAKRQRDLKDVCNKFNVENIEVETAIDFGKFQEKLENYIDDNPIDLIVMGSSGETSLSELFKGNHAARAMRAAYVPVLVVKEYTTFHKDSKMLILLDTKKYGDESIRMIRNFVNLFNMEVHLAHVKQPEVVGINDIQENMESFARASGFANFQTHVIGEGEMSEQISEFAKAHEIDIIASITEGDSGLVRLIYGSDTEKFLEEIEQPLLVVNDI